MTPHEALKTYWGYDAFRSPQEEIIQSVLDGRPTLALLPTGGGKSVCFQVPTLCMEGICIVISPLVALMKDQVMQLRGRGIRAAALYSGMTRKEIDITLDNCIYGNVKFLYVSPERLKTELFLERARQMNICLLAVDEAHCISQWGYDFRPSYRSISEFLDEVKVSRIIAVTASATKEVKADILEKLRMEDTWIYKKSFARSNLSYSVLKPDNKERKMLDILAKVQGTSIVYVRSRKRTKEVADLLKKSGISAEHYHAGLTPEERSKKQDDWIQSKVRVMVATNAFGMGIDKPDVRSVIHLDLPDSLEAYYQEAGRAGRDEKKAFAVVLCSKADVTELAERVERTSTTPEQLKRAYQALSNYYKLAVGSGFMVSYEFDEQKFLDTYNLPATETYYAVQKLQDEGLIQLSEHFHQSSRIIFLIPQEEVYKFQVAHSALDRTIKALLRLYGGELFTQYITIREKELSALLKESEQEIIRSLEFLQTYEVIEYQKATDKPQLTFLTPRQDINRLEIDHERIAWRRKVALSKAASVKEYVESTYKCRSRLIQYYFDEQMSQNCEACDICLDRRKQEKKLPLEEVLAFLESGKKSEDELMAFFINMEEDELVMALRHLMDKGRIRLDEQENFVRI